MRTCWVGPEGAWRTTLRGRQILADPRINKGTAFSDDERADLDLIGLIPAGHLTLDQQASRIYAQFLRQSSNLARNVLLNELHDRNEVLYYRVLSDHLSVMLPVIYTPTVGQAIENYSHEYRRPRGVYLSVDQPELIERSLRAYGLGADDVDLIVVTDAGAILGIGDWGVGGMSIAVGKLVVYTAAGGIDPGRTIPVMLDVGTDRQSLLDDPMYIGNRHPRVSPAEYDAFVVAFVAAVKKLFPRAVLHWEDVATANARRLLTRYRDVLPSFNDDVQGTGAVNLAAILAAVKATGIELPGHRIVIFGAGSAGTGIADQLTAALVAGGLTDAAARARFWAVDKNGLILSDADGLSEAQRKYGRDSAEVADWHRDETVGGITLAEVVRRVHPTVLIGTSARGGAFTEDIVKDMAGHADRPVIMPMSNPTELAEARPADLIEWTGGRALVATGSPFPPVEYRGTKYVIGQANNALVFPGLGLGAIAVRAAKITDGMLSAAAHAVASLVDTSAAGAPLLPQVADLRDTSLTVAVAVAEAAIAAGVSTGDVPADLAGHVQALMWRPVYRLVRSA
ncbi:MAG TPA: NAD-dependent malic enzyme [Streptosporangiaceae bacterium]|nr:NAD-dependent malic enzyme [Streptosporangiaceae bacterium]